jgi:flagellar motor switch protein FliM
MGIFNMGTLEGNCILEMNLTLAFSIIDRLFGGLGGTFDKIRPLTEIEEAVIKKIMSRMLLNLREAWNQVYEINPKLLMTESNPQFTQIVGPNEMVVLISFEMKVHEVEGMVNLCIPGIVLEPIAQNLSAYVWYASIKKSLNDEELEAVKQKLYNSDLDVVVELGSTTVTLKDLLELKEGDYIRLDNKVNKFLKVKAGSKVKFIGKPGKVGKRLAVEIKKVLNDEEAKLYE